MHVLQQEASNTRRTAGDDPFAAMAADLNAQLAASDAGAVGAVETAIQRAVEHRASDVHFEPWADALALRFRIDGALHDVARLPKANHPRIVARLKVLAKLPVYEKMTPQDGRIEAPETPAGKAIRLSTFPTVHGEKAVLRILDRENQLLPLPALGFSEAIVNQLRDLIALPQGVLLLTGPSSSGKTTTIYALLREMMQAGDRARNIATIEDPVECRLDRVAQTQISPHSSVTFVTALRSLLRQDPDVIMVGEIRDADTARAAIQAGLSGHLVISTIHCGSAAGVFGRLLDMGIEPSLLASSVTGVLAQRLVRLNCPECKAPYTPAPELLERYPMVPPDGPLMKGSGCARCHGIGYSGRAAVGELLRVNRELADLLPARTPTSRIHAAAVANGMTPLLEDALANVKAGETTLEELRHVIPPPDDA